ncbi:peptide ligase PGM1-related protein [Streptomyces sp. NPDC096097]|uniref:peptide ligase PGM1-related protein n=1 Tax=Streptomyces sp. NPDC096097 TaxID=3155546 RepID=UPI0033266D0F
MVTRLTAGTVESPPAWSVSKGRTRVPIDFETALFRLRASRLAFDPERGEGVVLYADAPPDGRSWRYAVLARSPGGVRKREAASVQFFAFEGGG